MKDAPPPLPERVWRKLRTLVLAPRLRRYLAAMSKDNPLHGLPATVVGDASADSTEFFDHYDAFAFWVAARLAGSPRRRILDVGSAKMMCAMLSAQHEVTSYVLADCLDRFSAVRYVRHDIADRLPAADGTFDCFTSSAALQLVGLGRYGDRLDPDCLPRFVGELDRVMTPAADLFVSMCLGPDLLAFNNSWLLSEETIRRIFVGWKLEEIVVDHYSSPRTRSTRPPEQRFDRDSDISHIRKGDYRVIFCHFRRAAA